MRVAEKAKSKGGFLTWRGEAEKSCDRRKKKKLLRRLCSGYESIGGRMAARFGEYLVVPGTIRGPAATPLARRLQRSEDAQACYSWPKIGGCVRGPLKSLAKSCYSAT